MGDILANHLREVFLVKLLQPIVPASGGPDHGQCLLGLVAQAPAYHRFLQMAPTRVHVGVAHSSFPLSGPVCRRLE